MENSRIYAALIAGFFGIIMSLITIYWLKPIIDKKFHLFQLDTNFHHEQAKAIRKAIGKYKAKLLNSAELLNSRFRNFSKVHSKNWLDTSDTHNYSVYYHDSMIYRFVSFYSYMNLIESELQYLDTTYSEKSDLEMIKYFRIFKDIFSDADLYGVEYNRDLDKDTIFRNDIDKYANVLIHENNVISYNDFLADDKYKKSLEKVYDYFDGISPEETDRKRIENIKCLHCVLMSFLGYYGYDFHKTKYEKIEKLSGMLGPLKYKDGLFEIINRYKLNLSITNLKVIINKYSN